MQRFASTQHEGHNTRDMSADTRALADRPRLVDKAQREIWRYFTYKAKPIKTLITL